MLLLHVTRGKAGVPTPPDVYSWIYGEYQTTEVLVHGTAYPADTTNGSRVHIVRYPFRDIRCWKRGKGQ